MAAVVARCCVIARTARNAGERDALWYTASVRHKQRLVATDRTRSHHHIAIELNIITTGIYAPAAQPDKPPDNTNACGV